MNCGKLRKNLLEVNLYVPGNRGPIPSAHCGCNGDSTAAQHRESPYAAHKPPKSLWAEVVRMTILLILGKVILDSALILLAWLGISLGLSYLLGPLLDELGRDDE